jgi:hypothetical protein
VTELEKTKLCKKNTGENDRLLDMIMIRQTQPHTHTHTQTCAVALTKQMEGVKGRHHPTKAQRKELMVYALGLGKPNDSEGEDQRPK